jgi:ketosteroid isomerase-like protein
MATLLTEDIVWSDPALPAPVYGIPPVQEFMRASFRTFSNLHFSEPDPPHFTVNGDLVAWAWRMEGTMTGPAEPPGFAPTGRSMRVDGVDLWTMSDGRIARYQAFYDMNDVARQLGIVPPRGSGAERAMVALQRLQARFMRR